MIEIILITAIFAVIGTGMVSTLLSGSHASKQGGDYVVARGYVGEALEAVKSIRDQAWSNLTNGVHGLTTSASKFELNGTSETLPGGFTRTVTIEDVYRNGNLTGDIASSGLLDTKTKKVSINVAWTVFASKIKSLTSIFYVTNWTSLAWVQTLLAEFDAGLNNSSATTTTSGGEVVLVPASASWNGVVARYSMDANGSGDLLASVFDETHNWLVTLQESTSGDELQVFDTANVTHTAPTVLRGKELTLATDVVVKGDYAFVAADEAGTAGAEIVIVDLFSMATVASIDLPQNAAATAVAVNGTLLAVGRENHSNTQEVFFYDIANPAAPTLRASTELGFAVTDIVLNNQNAFVASSSNTAEIIAVDLSTASIVLTLDLPTAANAQSLAISGTDVYVGRASGSNPEVERLDGSNPESGMPTLASLEVGSSVNHISLDQQATTIALATSSASGELLLANANDLSVFQTVDTPISGSGSTASVYGTNVFFGNTDHSEELLVYGIVNAGWSDPQILGTANQSNPRPGSALFVSGNYAYIGTTSGSAKPEFTIYDISNPSVPTYVGSYAVGSSVNRIVVSGNYAYLGTASTSSEFQILDITNKAAPSLLSSVNLSGSQAANALVMSGTTMFVGVNSSSSPEVYVVNISSPASPSVIGSLHLTGDVLDLGVYSTRLYAATTNNAGEMAIINILIPSLPTLLSLYNASGNQDGAAISIFSSILTLGRLNGSNPEINILDISNPVPSLLGTGQTGGSVVSLSQIDGDTLEVASTESGAEYQRWNISTPGSPMFISSVNLGANGVEVFENGSNVVLATTSTTQALQMMGPLTLPDVAREAIFTSQAYDATTVTTWDSLDWTTSGTGTVELMIRTADTEANLQLAKWVGPLGTSASRFTTSGTAITTDPSATGTRWIQFEAILSGDGSTSPSLLDVSASYSP